MSCKSRHLCFRNVVSRDLREAKGPKAFPHLLHDVALQQARQLHSLFIEQVLFKEVMRACWRKSEACNNRANARHVVAWGRKEAVRLLLSACAAIALITSCASPFSYMSHHIDPGNGDEQTLTGVHCLGLTVISCPPAQPIVSCGSQSRTWQCEEARHNATSVVDENRNKQRAF